MKEPKKPKRKANSGGTKLVLPIAAFLQAVDELGIDSVALVRQQLEEEGVLPKPQEDKNDNS